MKRRRRRLRFFITALAFGFVGVATAALSRADVKPLGPPLPSTVPRSEAERRLAAEDSRQLPPEAKAQLESWRGPDGRIHPPPLPVSGPDGRVEQNPDGSVKLYDPNDRGDARNVLPPPRGIPR